MGPVRMLLAVWLALPLSAAEPPCVPGSIVPTDRDAPYMLVAPHGDFDAHTAAIADSACRRLGWDCLIAQGQRTKGHPVNVNRPTEGVGVKASEEAHTTCAAAIYAQWGDAARRLNAAPKLYVEVHGNKHKETRGRVEVAVVGVGPEVAARVKALLLKARAAHELEWMDVWVEGVDPIRYKATSSKRWGQLSVSKAALHFEFPMRARKEQSEDVAAFLAAALAEVVRTEFR